MPENMRLMINGVPFDVTNGALNIQLTGSKVITREIITSNTVITAGSNVTYGPYDSIGSRVGAGVALLASNKWQLYLSGRDSSAFELGRTSLYDASATASATGNGSTFLASPRYALRFYNLDTDDITIRRLSMIETA